jgi:uncharacterized protein (DUF305 family)
MNRNTIAAVIVGLVIGVAGTLGVSAATDKNDTSKTVTSTASSDHSSMSMADMSAQLKGKTGDDFDKTFVAEMISHHQGAIDMAKLAQTNAKHAEIKSLAGNIISAQTSEISQMQLWQTQWGYVTSSSNDSMQGMDHMSH